MNTLKEEQFRNGAYLAAFQNSRGNVSVYAFYTRRPNLHNARRHFERLRVKGKETLLDVVQVKTEEEWDTMAMALAQGAILVE